MITREKPRKITWRQAVTKPREPKAGEKLSEQEAKAYVDYLYSTLYKYAHEKIHKGAFMTQLREGKLPLPVMRQFFKNWGRFSLEVNALNAVSYYTHLPFFVRHFDLLGPFCAKIADELISPHAPGHVLVLLQTAEKMGLSKKEVLEDPYLPAARAINDFCHKIFIDGSIIELWGLHVFEESLSHWSGEWYTALTAHYGLSKQQAIYFSTHEEADMDTHRIGLLQTPAVCVRRGVSDPSYTRQPPGIRGNALISWGNATGDALQTCFA